LLEARKAFVPENRRKECFMMRLWLLVLVLSASFACAPAATVPTPASSPSKTAVPWEADAGFKRSVGQSVQFKLVLDDREEWSARPNVPAGGSDVVPLELNHLKTGTMIRCRFKLGDATTFTAIVEAEAEAYAKRGIDIRYRTLDQGKHMELTGTGKTVVSTVIMRIPKRTDIYLVVSGEWRTDIDAVMRPKFDSVIAAIDVR
jgi:hypothetical protein